jgi:hypothetical protein
MPPWNESNVPNDPTTVGAQAKIAIIGLPVALVVGGVIGYVLGRRR